MQKRFTSTSDVLSHTPLFPQAPYLLHIPKTKSTARDHAFQFPNLKLLNSQSPAQRLGQLV
ncbi:MAG TPA: hypothetical protein VII23_11875, partial [Terriglobales bacterium]